MVVVSPNHQSGLKWSGLALLIPLSLVLLEAVRAATHGVLRSIGWDNSLAWVAQVGVPGTLASLCMFLFIGRGAGLSWPKRPAPRTIVLIVAVTFVWFALVLAVSAFSKVHIPGPRTVEGAFSFLVFGPVAEEFLFRGALFALLFNRASRPQEGMSTAVWITAVVFALAQFQHTDYDVTSLSLRQAIFAFPLGLLFGHLRQRTGTVWPAVGAHMLTNLPPTVVGLV